MSYQHYIFSVGVPFETCEQAEAAWDTHIKEHLSIDKSDEYIHEGEILFGERHYPIVITYHTKNKDYWIELEVDDSTRTLYVDESRLSLWKNFVRLKFPDLKFTPLIYSWYDGGDRP